MYKVHPVSQVRQLLDAGYELSLQQLKHQLGLSERQVRRILREFNKSGIILKERWNGRQKFFSLPAERQQVALSDLSFDQDELRALAIAAKASRSVLVGTPHCGALERAFEKLLERAKPITYIFELEEPLQDWQFEDNATDQLSIDSFRQLEKAMDERRSVQIDYLTSSNGRASVGRKIDPYFFAKRGRAWMLIAHCHQRNAIRNFSISSISRVESCDSEDTASYFELPVDLQPENYFRDALGAINSGECYVLRLSITPKAALYFRKRQYHPTQMVEQELPNGGLIISFELQGFEEMRSFCQSWGTGVTVLEPKELRERLRKDALELVAQYV
jgi:predicted DNA-binding transcriptional regulator YafY